MSEEKQDCSQSVRGSPDPSEFRQRGDVQDHGNDLKRHLGNRQIQLIAIGGSIGTALFVSIGGALNSAGPVGLLLAITIYCIVMGFVNNAMAEMGTYMPVPGGFIRLAGHWVDEALGFMAGWNFFLYQSLQIPFEITAVSLVLSFWRDDIPPAAVCTAIIVFYAACNAITVRWYGEAEFWLSGGKVILILILYSFTFVTMVGGNPQKDAYGFRHWSDPGPIPGDTALGRFESFLSAMFFVPFFVVGPEYISMISGEAERPRTYIKSAFKTVYYRFGAFFILGALCVGTIVAYNDPQLITVLKNSEKSASASPYVIAMKNLKVQGLPHLVNALLITSIFSAGNTYTYCASRSLYSLALEGRAPQFLRKCTKSGVPIYCLVVVICFSCLSYLQLSNDSAVVLQWLINILTAGGLINFIVILGTYIAFYRACQAQGFDRRSLPYYGWLQPYGTYFALAFEILVVFCYGYTTFLPGNFSAESFMTYYTMVIIAPILFVFWKVLKRTKWKSPGEVDLTWDAALIDAYEASLTTPPTTFWREMIEPFRRPFKHHPAE